MPSNWTALLASTALALLCLGPLVTLARPADLKEEMPVEEMYNELIEEEQKLHEKEVNYIQMLGSMAAREIREEELLEHRQERQRAHLAAAAAAANEQEQASLLDEFPVDSAAAAAANRLAREQQVPMLPKPLPYQKAKEEKKNNHYMALCHFKLCNMGRKRNTRFLHFWN